jgi:hypothetical protein
MQFDIAAVSVVIVGLDAAQLTGVGQVQVEVIEDVSALADNL